MSMIFDKRELSDYPLVERTISIFEQKRIRIEFELIGDLDTCITYWKEYSTPEDASKSITSFLNKEKVRTTNNVQSLEFPLQIAESKKHLFNDVIAQKIRLPDEGKGYQYNGDIEYLSSLI